MGQNPSNFAGQFNATAYAYGCPGCPGPLVLSSAIPAGLAVPSVEFGFIGLEDGSQFYPLNTNAPIRLGSAAATETVTPSAVSVVSQAYGGMNFAANFTNSHGIGEQISSATFGLQEAINAAHASGGGSVIIDSAWAALGGTTAIRNAATLPSGVTILDYRTGFTGGTGSDITIDSTAITGGTDGQFLIELGGKVSQTPNLAWDNLNGLQVTVQAAADGPGVQAGYFQVDANGKTLTAGIGFRIASPVLNGGSIGTPYGLEVDPQVGGFAISTQAGKTYLGDTLIVHRLTAPADGDLAAGDIAFWFDDSNGAAKLMLKAKQADGTVKTGSVNVQT
jgi:hypothetical protein